MKLIDFERPQRNHFIAINQFRIDPPGATKGLIIPDIVLFVNGLRTSDIGVVCGLAYRFGIHDRLPLYQPEILGGSKMFSERLQDELINDGTAVIEKLSSENLHGRRDESGTRGAAAATV